MKTRLAVILGSRNNICNGSVSKYNVATKLHDVLGVLKA